MKIVSERVVLSIQSLRDGIVTLCSVAGQLVERLDLEEGETHIPMRQALYLIRLKDGTLQKVVVR